MTIHDEVLLVYERMKDIDHYYFDTYFELTSPEEWEYLYWQSMNEAFDSMTWEQQIYYCLNFSFHNIRFKELLNSEQIASIQLMQ